MNLPSDFIQHTRRLMGDEACDALCAALQQDIPVSIRMNTRKCPSVPSHSRPVPWAADGYYLTARPTFTFDPLFHAGSYYVQEASSMFLEQALRQYVHQPVAMLDLCAAPGGKSTLSSAVLPEGSLLVSNEVMRNRVQVLAENLVKWGNPRVVVTHNDPADFQSVGPVFDVVLTDVPCSGEGMFRKDEGAVNEWSEDNVALCWQRQRRILRDVWPCLKPGGLLVYSTCTFNREENEDNVAWIAAELGAEVLPLQVPDEWNITGSLTGAALPVYRFLPHRTVGEGLFMAVLRKEGNAPESEPFSLPTRSSGKNAKKGKGGKPTPVVAFPKELKAWLSDETGYTFRTDNGYATAFPSEWDALYQHLNSSLRVLHAGVTLAELKGRDWQPHHSLAMSTVCRREAFPQAELDYSQAIAYLRKEAVVLGADVPKGYVLLTYHRRPLGFARNVGNRANNLYPNEWRIRSGHVPEEVRPVSFPDVGTDDVSHEK